MNNEGDREQPRYTVEQMLSDNKREKRRSSITTAILFIPMLISWFAAYLISDNTKPYEIKEVRSYSQLKEIDSDCNVLLHYDTVINTDWDLVVDHGPVEIVEASFYGLVNNDSLVYVILEYDSLKKFQSSNSMLVSLSYKSYPEVIGDTLTGGYSVMKVEEKIKELSDNGKQLVKETKSRPYIFEDEMKMDERLELFLIIGPFAYLLLFLIISNVVVFVSWIRSSFGKGVSIAAVILMLFFVLAVLFTLFNS